MAIRDNRDDVRSFELVGHTDDALADDFSKDDYAEYVKTADYGKLRFKPNATPTKFAVNFDLKKIESVQLKNSMIAAKDDEGKPTMSWGSWQYAVAKLCLKGIINPTDIPAEFSLQMKKDDKGNAHDDLLVKLDKHEVLADIFALYQAVVLKPERAETKNS